MSERVPPPYVLDAARVLFYAFVDDLSYRRSGALYVGDKLVEAVPRLAICVNLGEDMGALLFHCDEHWVVLGVSGGGPVAETKERAEKNYPGVGAHWIDLGASHDQALAFYDSNPDHTKCSFCLRRPFQFDGFAEKAGVRICHECIDRLYSLFRERREAGGNEG